MAVYVFDVNETLSDLAPMGTRFAEVGLPPTAAQLWFAALLRDGIGVAAAGGLVRFADAARGVLAPMLPGDPDAVQHVMAGFQNLPVHPDVPAGVRALRAAGHRLATLSNGAAEVAAGLLGRAGVRDQFEALLSVEDAGAWKPARAAYLYAADRLRVRPAEATLVAVHPWDIDGAARAGLRTAWINRTGAAYPAHLTSPERTVRTVGELA
ncbi:MAG TPA: haloacid dehalogenase type II [Mycobacteriales bacterium]|jgi:2-haloacid dehalogenase|nr:haloacid dehalogenase type II [Mycobacteriales bacterium]